MNEIESKLKAKLKTAGYDLDAMIEIKNFKNGDDYSGVMEMENEEMEKAGNNMGLFLRDIGALRLR